MSNDLRNVNSTLTLNTSVSTVKNIENIGTKSKKKVTFKPPRKTMSTPTLSLKIRRDIFGEEIKKGGKQKISFADNVLLCVHENDDEDSVCLSEKGKKVKKEETLIEIIDIVSYKEQNKKMVYKGNGENPPEENVCCESCEIF